ncbi:hypothetical protein JX265_013990 [Neoarthrinium moseri]|uniref:Uncharacterized protein n=1 Tax=Neoarthrinium moseri TaxID=1658444 RepID=A0A9P9W7L1_9PEZI|nr:hypothetical protein JX265_013990 [Neoarthrinium moseri]
MSTSSTPIAPMDYLNRVSSDQEGTSGHSIRIFATFGLSDEDFFSVDIHQSLEVFDTLRIGDSPGIGPRTDETLSLRYDQYESEQQLYAERPKISPADNTFLVFEEPPSYQAFGQFFDDEEGTLDYFMSDETSAMDKPFLAELADEAFLDASSPFPTWSQGSSMETDLDIDGLGVLLDEQDTLAPECQGCASAANGPESQLQTQPIIIDLTNSSNETSKTRNKGPRASGKHRKKKVETSRRSRNPRGIQKRASSKTSASCRAEKDMPRHGVESCVRIVEVQRQSTEGPQLFTWNRRNIAWEDTNKRNLADFVDAKDWPCISFKILVNGSASLYVTWQNEVAMFTVEDDFTNECASVSGYKFQRQIMDGGAVLTLDWEPIDRYRS